MYRSIAIAVVIFIMISCKQEKPNLFEASNSLGKPLQKIDSFVLLLDSMSNYEIFSHQLVDIADKEYLYVLNKQHRSIEAYDLDSGHLIKRFRIITEEPYGIPNPYGFFFANHDTLLIFNQNSFKKTQLLNSAGELKGSFTPDNMMEYKYGLNHYSLPTDQSWLIDKKIYFAVLPTMETSDPTNINTNLGFSGIFDLNANKLIQVSPITFPYSYIGKGWSSFHTSFSWTKNSNNEIVVSWNAMDSLYIYNLKFELIKKVAAKSHFLNTIEPIKKGSNLEMHLHHAIYSGLYRRILYDPYRDCYYRMVIHGRDTHKQSDTNSRAFELSEFSVMVLTSEFEIIAESKFEGGQYNIFTSFVSKRGLAFPKTNYFDKSLEEEKLYIDIFR